MEPHHKALERAKIALMRKPDTTFYTTLCFSMRHVWDESIETACTDGVTHRYNPAFFMSLSEGARVSLLVHETSHTAHEHFGRRGSRDHQRFNVAGDHAINLHLKSRGFEIPGNWMCDPQYVGMSAEQIYNLLPEECGQPSMDDMMPPPMSKEKMAEHVKDLIVRAAIQSQIEGDAAGAIPSDIEVFLDKLLKPKLPWHRILAKYIRALAKTDYSFRRPNRRYLPDLYMPTMHSEKLMDIAFAIDTSGSVSQDDFTRIVSEVYGIFRMMKPKKMTVIHFDTEIKSVDTVRNINDLNKIKFTGRGGTCIHDITLWANKHKPQLMVVFTDGYFRKIPATTKVPVLWIIHNNPDFVPPYGRAVHYEI